MVDGEGGDGGAGLDFFVSYTWSDQRWAEWIGWVLEDAGYRVVMQAWDFGPGSHFVAEMHHAVRRAARTVAVMSAAYQASTFAAEEWQAAWVTDPGGRARRLLVLRVEDCPRDGLLRQLVSVDLFGVDRGTTRSRLLAAVQGDRLKPDVEPVFPSAGLAGRGEPALPRPPEVWGMPWPRNPNFVGRVAELAVLRGRVRGGSGTAVVLPQALHGLGGVGKTQMAVEYAYRHVADYELVWWVPAEQPPLVIAALAELAARLGVAVTGEARDSAEAVLEVLRQGHRFTRWLVIADNAGEVSDLSGLLTAASDNGHVLITSRDPGWSEAARTVEVDVLTRLEAVALLRARAPRLTSVEAEQVAGLLGDLPLAVEQAGAWLASSGMSAADYIDAVEHRTGEILAEGKPRGYPAPVAATWTVALDVLDETAVWLLRMWAFMGPEPIPADLINADTAQVLPPQLAPLGDPLLRGRTLATLVRLGLVRLVDNGVVLHRLVQAVLRDHTPVADRDVIRAGVHRVLAAGAPDDTDDPVGWGRWAVLYPHALAVRIVEGHHDGIRELTLGLCDYLRSSGNYPASLALAREAHRYWSQALGGDHPDTITAAANLAATLRSLGEYPAAREMEQDVLARYREVLGEDHPSTITAAANLAAWTNDHN